MSARQKAVLLVLRAGWILLIPRVLLRCYQPMLAFRSSTHQEDSENIILGQPDTKREMPFFFTIFKSRDILNPLIWSMSHDHLMLTEPEMITVAVLWELSLQLSYGEEHTAPREKRKERRNADSRAMPISLGEQRVPVSPQRKGNYGTFKEEVEFPLHTR